MGYKVYNGGTEYIAYTSSGKSDMYAQDHDIVVYSINQSYGDITITARIERPSAHTLYLISQGRCYLDFDYRVTAGSYRNHAGKYGKQWRRCLWATKVTNPNSITIDCTIGEGQTTRGKRYTINSEWRNFENIYGILTMAENHDDLPEGWYVDIRPILISVGNSSYSSNALCICTNCRPYKTEGLITQISNLT